MVLASGDPGIDATTEILLPSTAFALVAVAAVVAVAAFPVHAAAVVAVAALPVQVPAEVAVAALPVHVPAEVAVAALPVQVPAVVADVAVAAWVESSCAWVFVTGPVMFGNVCFKTRLIFLMWSSAWDRGSVAVGSVATRSSM